MTNTNPDPISQLAEILLDVDLVDDHVAAAIALRPVLLPAAWTALAESLELCPVHACDVEICRDDELECQS